MNSVLAKTTTNSEIIPNKSFTTKSLKSQLIFTINHNSPKCNNADIAILLHVHKFKLKMIIDIYPAILKYTKHTNVIIIIMEPP